MEPKGEHNPGSWDHIEQLFKLRKDLQKDLCEKNSYLDTVKIQEVESILYEELKPQVRPILFTVIRGNIPEEVIEEVTSKAIQSLFDEYAAFRGDASLRTYFTNIVKNAAFSCLKKMSREKRLFVYDEQDLIHADDEKALQTFREKESRERRDEMAARVADLFELIDFQEQNLTDKEFVAIALKFVNLRMKRKFTDEELARKLGMRRTTFLDSFQRGADKICRYWKERKIHGK